MADFLVSFRAVGPLFLLLALGWFFRRRALLDGTTMAKLSRLTHYVFLPALLLKNVLDCNLDAGLPWRIVLIAALSSTLSCLLSVAIACMTEKSPARRGALAQGMFRNNYVSYGLAIASSIYAGQSCTAVSMLIACIVPLNNIYAVVVLTVFSGRKLSARRLLREIAANPFVIAAALGFALSALRLSLPPVLSSTLGSLSALGVPLSMLMLGASFSFSDAKAYRRDIAVGATVKLVLLPGCFLPVYILLGIRGESLLALLIALATPPAASSHVMAGQMGADRTLAGHLIVFGSLASVFTLFLWLWLLKGLMLL